MDVLIQFGPPCTIGFPYGAPACTEFASKAEIPKLLPRTHTWNNAVIFIWVSWNHTRAVVALGLTCVVQFQKHSLGWILNEFDSTDMTLINPDLLWGSGLLFLCSIGCMVLVKIVKTCLSISYSEKESCVMSLLYVGVCVFAGWKCLVSLSQTSWLHSSHGPWTH